MEKLLKRSSSPKSAIRVSSQMQLRSLQFSFALSLRRYSDNLSPAAAATSHRSSQSLVVVKGNNGVLQQLIHSSLSHQSPAAYLRQATAATTGVLSFSFAEIGYQFKEQGI